MTPRPHDALFKAAFESPAAAARLLSARLAPELRAAILWDSLKLESGSFVDPSLADSHNDLLFSARLDTDADDWLLLLLEHQSTDDAAMPLRALSYENRIWNRCQNAQLRASLLPIIAVVVSHVEGGWLASPRFEDMFEPRVLAMAGLASLVPRFSLLIDDLEHLTDDDLKARSLGAFQQLALWLLRDARDPRRLLDQFDSWIDAWTDVEGDLAQPDAFVTLVNYMFRVVDPSCRDAVRAKLESVGTNRKECIMTIADQLHEEGRQKGHKEGLHQGREEGIYQGLQQGREEGRQEGREEGLRQGLQQGRQEGREEVLDQALQQVRHHALADAVRGLLVRKFHALGVAEEDRLQVASTEMLYGYLLRVLRADSLADVFVD